MFDYKLCNEKASRMFFLALMFFGLVISLSSCAKDQETNAGVGGIVNAVVSIDGIKSLDISSSLRASIGNQVGLQLPESSRIESFSQDDVSFDIVSEEVDLATKVGFAEKVKSISKLAATDPMAGGVKYRLILYNASNDQFFATLEAEVGVSRNIGLVSGQTYKWYAYSYNTKESIPAPTDLSNPKIVTPTANTLLYASGSITAFQEGMPLHITFAHQLTQLKVEVKEGIRDILGSSAKFASSDYVKTSTFNLKNGAKTEFKSAGLTNLDFVSHVNGDTVMRVAQYYTADDQLTSYKVDFASIDVQYTANSQRQVLPSQMPSLGKVTFNFPAGPSSKRGYILKGSLKLSFVLPAMDIIAWSNSTTYGYKLDPGTASGSFIRSKSNFGPNSKYVKIKDLKVTSIAYTGVNHIRDLLSNPANYPAILVIANSYNYLSDASFDAVRKYLEAGGSVFYTQDREDRYLERFLQKYLGPSVKHKEFGEDKSVSKFTDTPEAEADVEILNGPFGDVRPYHWGQDVIGTPYVFYSGNDIIKYSTHSQNYKNPGANATSFFRHKKDSFFYVGDGGFLANDIPGDYGGAKNWHIAPFRTTGNSGTDMHFPVISLYGIQAQVNSPTYYFPHKGASVGTYQIANSMIFGNIIAWMLNRSHYYKK